MDNVSRIDSQPTNRYLQSSGALQISNARGQANKSLYDYTLLNGLNDDQCHLVFLSDRDLSIIDEALQWSDHQRTRVYNDSNYPARLYSVVEDGEWQDFKVWISNLRTRLNDYDMTNELLERIADNLQMDVVTDNQGTVETRSITEVLAGHFGGAEFDELIAAIDDHGQGITDYGLKDMLEMMTYTKDLLPNFNAPSLFALMRTLVEMRFRHNVISQLGMINANLRYQGLALSPRKGSATEADEQSFIEDIFTELDTVPWLTSGVAALADPTPAGETVLAGKFAQIIGSKIFTELTTWLWSIFTDGADDIPEASIVGMLEKIANAAGGGSNSQSLTFQQIINNISSAPGDDDQTDFPYLYSILSDVMDFLPDDQGDYPIPDPATLVQTAILDRSINNLQTELAKIPGRLAPDDTNNIAASMGQVNTTLTDKLTLFLSDLSEIKDSLAGIDGDTDALARLECICEELMGLSLNLDEGEVFGPIDEWNEPGEYRCDAAKWFLGKMTEIFGYVNSETDKGPYLPSDIIGDVEDYFRSITVSIFQFLGFEDNYLTQKLEPLTAGDTTDLETVILDLRDQWLNDIYTAATPDDAVTDMLNTLDNYTPSGFTVSQDMRNSIESFLQRSRGLERVFLPSDNDLAVTIEERDIYSGWSEFACGGVWNCFPQLSAWNYGSPSPFQGGTGPWNLTSYPVGTWVTITSEWLSDGNNSTQRVQCTFDDAYTLEIEVLSIPAGKTLRMYVTDCDNQYMYDTQDAGTGLVYTGYADQFFATTLPLDASNPGTFQIRIRRID